MSRRSFVTPLIVAVLVSVATGLTFSTAGSAPAPVAHAPRSATEIPATGLIVGRGLPAGSAADLADAFDGWRIDVADGARRDRSAVVVIEVRADLRRWRPYLLRYAAEVLPRRTTVVFAPPGSHRRAVQRTAVTLSRTGPAGRTH